MRVASQAVARSIAVSRSRPAPSSTAMAVARAHPVPRGLGPGWRASRVAPLAGRAGEDVGHHAIPAVAVILSRRLQVPPLDQHGGDPRGAQLGGGPTGVGQRLDRPPGERRRLGCVGGGERGATQKRRPAARAAPATAHRRSRRPGPGRPPPRPRSPPARARSPPRPPGPGPSRSSPRPARARAAPSGTASSTAAGRARLDRPHTATALLGPGRPHPSHRRPELGAVRRSLPSPAARAGIDAADRHDDRTVLAVIRRPRIDAPSHLRRVHDTGIMDAQQESEVPAAVGADRTPRKVARKKARRGSSPPPADSVR